MIDITFREFKKGQTFHIGYGYPVKIHIEEVIHTETTWDKVVVVYRFYGKRKQWWHWALSGAWMLEQEIKSTQEIKNKKK